METDHKALYPIFKKNCIEKQYSSRRLIRWRRRLLPYNFEAVYKPGGTKGLTDVLSRNPHEAPPTDRPLEEQSFVIANLEALNDIKHAVSPDHLLACSYKQRRKVHRNNKANTAEKIFFANSGHKCFELPAGAIRHAMLIRSKRPKRKFKTQSEENNQTKRPFDKLWLQNKSGSLESITKVFRKNQTQKPIRLQWPKGPTLKMKQIWLQLVYLTCSAKPIGLEAMERGLRQSPRQPRTTKSANR